VNASKPSSLHLQVCPGLPVHWASPETGAILRHITLNLLRQDPNTKESIRHRRLKAALSQEYRLAALLGFPGKSANA
jgi:hypothetical protein